MSGNKINSTDTGEDAPLDPAVERVRRKMMRLMGISIAIMMIGLIAVIGAIFYRISNPTSENVAETVAVTEVNAGLAGNIKLPGGSTMVKAELSGGQILLTIEDGQGALALWIYDVVTNRVTAKIGVQ